MERVVDQPALTSTVGVVAPPPQRSDLDVAMRRLLRISDAAAPVGEPEARQAFSRSIAISAIRCLLTYVVFPFVAPVLGWASDIGPIPGIAIGLVAIAFNVKSIRRFWLSDHRWRWAYTAVGGTVIVLLLVLMGEDLVHLLG
ncbi:MAG: hypothetical protein AB7L84_04950 [Acidimicrobiia bacterium]